MVSESDPTGDDIEWLVTSGDTDPDPAGTWTAGTWTGTWSSATGRVDARSPTVGGSTAAIDLDATGEGEYVLWCRWTAGTSRPVKDVATVRYGF